VITVSEGLTQTEGQTTYCGTTALCAASRGKKDNYLLLFLVR